MDITEIEMVSHEAFIGYIEELLTKFIGYIEELITKIETEKKEGWEYKLDILQFILRDIG